MSLPTFAHKNVLGVVLAGGQSRRMGRDKAGIEIAGAHETFGARAVRVVSACADEVIVVGHGRGMPPGLVTIADSGEGPLVAIVVALAYALAHNFDSMIVVPVDMPALTENALKKLIQADADAVFYVDGDDEHPLPIVLSTLTYNALSGCVRSGTRSLHHGISSISRVVRMSVEDGGVLRNVNRLE